MRVSQQNKKNFKSILSLSFLLLFSQSCEKVKASKAQEKLEHRSLAGNFSDYWYQGKAELNRYDLEQFRYGEKRSGEAIFVFVTEDFLSDKQVKYEFGDSKKAKKVLKLNKIRRFVTGVYDYSLMTSVFTPVYEKAWSYKISSTMQDWCGQDFAQMNRREGKIQYQIRSYFQNPSDLNISIDEQMCEDDILTTIRLNPNDLLLGEVNILLSNEDMRLNHREIKSYKAIAKQDDLDEHFSQYRVEYRELNRKLRFKYERKSPYRIQEIEIDAERSKSHYRLKKTILSPYWSKHSKQDEILRNELGVKGF